MAVTTDFHHQLPKFASESMNPKAKAVLLRDGVVPFHPFYPSASLKTWQQSQPGAHPVPAPCGGAQGAAAQSAGWVTGSQPGRAHAPAHSSHLPGPGATPRERGATPPGGLSEGGEGGGKARPGCRPELPSFSPPPETAPQPSAQAPRSS